MHAPGYVSSSIHPIYAHTIHPIYGHTIHPIHAQNMIAINLHLPPLIHISRYHRYLRRRVVSFRLLSIINFTAKNRSQRANVHLTTTRPRPRPFYDMASSQPTILTPTAIIGYMESGTGNNLLRRHECALRAAENLHGAWYPTAEMKRSTVPPALREIVDHYNKYHLNQPDDIPLVAYNLWGILFRRTYTYRQISQMSHEFVYIQQRYLDSDEVRLNKTIRRQANCKQIIGSDFHRIKSVVSIRLPSGWAYLYGAMDLHWRDHGSLSYNDIYHQHHKMNDLSIENSIVTPTIQNPKSQKRNGIFVEYQSSSTFDIIRAGCTIGLHSFHEHLTNYMMTITNTDQSRAGERIDLNDSTYVSTRVRFGFGREQKFPDDQTKSKCIHYYYLGTKMPTISYEPFLKMPIMVRKELRNIFECATQVLKIKMPTMLPKHNVRKACAMKLNAAMGLPSASMEFEYYDIVLTRNVVLPKHIDRSNDHRKGYNYCVVYSFFHIINHLEYKVSIIMTSRVSVGAALAKL